MSNGSADRPRVLGSTIDAQTRCIHYATELDIIAIRFFCCGEYYPCHQCHAEHADHPAARWPVDARSQRAILCGVCSTELTIDEYLAVDACPHCTAGFNPGCRMHRELYFEEPRPQAPAPADVARQASD